MNVRRAVELAVQIADAVADAHAAGFVHGGLSPDSVVITAKGHAKIPAFDLAAQSGLQSGRRRGQPARLRFSGRGPRPGSRRPVRHLFGRRVPLRDADDAEADAPGRRGAKRVEPARAGRAGRGRAEGGRAESRLPLPERGGTRRRACEPWRRPRRERSWTTTRRQARGRPRPSAALPCCDRHPGWVVDPVVAYAVVRISPSRSRTPNARAPDRCQRRGRQ